MNVPWLILALPLLGLVSCSSVEPTPPRMGENEWSPGNRPALPYTHWPSRPSRGPKSVVIAVHGLSGASSDFWYLAERLNPLGHDVYAMDLRGQGMDPDRAGRGDIASAEVWQDDLATFHQLVVARHPKQPVVWFGESLGALIALHASSGACPADRPKALILSSPVVSLRHPLSRSRLRLLKIGAAVWPSKRLTVEQIGGVDPHQIEVTTETTHGDQMDHTAHHVDAFSLRLLRQTGLMMKGATEAAGAWSGPTLVLAAPEDPIASPEGVATLADHLPQATLKWYPESRHLLLHDLERQQVMNDVVSWLDSRGMEDGSVR